MDTLEKEWPIAKSTGPASITMNGASIDEVLSVLQSQMDILRSVVSQQSTYIRELKQQREDDAKNDGRIAALEDQLKSDVITNIQEALDNHDGQIKELQDRPIIDPEQTERLEAVEKKFASFYGDDTNILGRVQHLENHTKRERETLSNSRDDIRKLNKGMEDNRKAIDNLKTKDIADHTKSIKKLKESKMDHVDIPREVVNFLKGADVPSREDVSRTKDMINSLADDWRNSIDDLQKSREQDMDHVVFRLDTHDEQLALAHGKGNGSGDNTHHTKDSQGNESYATAIAELAGRMTSLESRLARHDMNVDRVSKVEDQLQHSKHRLMMLEGDNSSLLDTTGDTTRNVHKIQSDMHGIKSLLDKLEYRLNIIDPLDHDERSPAKLPTSTLDSSVLRELQASVRALQTSAEQEIPIATIERVATRVVRKFQDTLGSTTGVASDTQSPLKPQHAAHDDEDVETLKGIAKELERRMYVMVEECHKGLETLQNDTSKKIHGMSTYLLESNPPCECHENLESHHTSAMGDPLSLLAYRKCRRQCPACTEKDMHSDIPDGYTPPSSGGKMDHISLLAYRRCKRRCPACVEKERKLGLPDIGIVPAGADTGDRLSDLEEKLSKLSKQLIKVKEDSVQVLRGQEDIVNDITELKHTVNVDHKNRLTHLQDNKMDNQDMHDLIQNAVRAERLPSHADIEALKNLCSLVASESRDNLDGLRSKTDKKLKSVINHLNQHDEDMVDLKTATQSTHNHIQTHDERLSTLETKQAADNSGGGDTSGIRSKIAQMEQNMSAALNKLSHQEDERKKQNGVVDGIRNSLTHLQHVVTGEHTPAIHKLQKKNGDGKTGNRTDTLMDDALKRALESANAMKANGVGIDDLDKVKRFAREIERRLFTLADECRDKFDETDGGLKKLSKFTIDCINRIVDHINGLNRHDVYIPSFPETTPHKPYNFMPSNAATDIREQQPGLAVLPSPIAHGNNKIQPNHQHGEPIQIDSPEEFDEFVRANFDFSKTQPVPSSKNSQPSMLNRPASAQSSLRKGTWNPRAYA